MLIYAGTKSDFMIDTENDRLETKLYENIKLKMNRTTGLSELNAWRNSLKEMYITLNDSDIPKDAGVALSLIHIFAIFRKRLAKKGDFSMKMHIIGTGTATVSKYINTSCVFEEDNQLFLVDGTGGSDILRAFDIMNLDWKHLHHAFLSHEHTDHFLGMIWVIRTIAELLELEEYEGDFYLYGNDEVLGKALQVCRMILKKRSQVFLETRIKFVVVKDHEKRHILNYDFTFFNIGSTKAKQYGFLMEYDNGKKLVFAGDEPLKENGKKYSKEVDWLLSEAFCLFNEEPKFHAYQYQHQTVKEASMIAQDLKVKNLLIWHTEDQTGIKRKERYSAEAKQFYEGNVWIPEDGEVFDI